MRSLKSHTDFFVGFYKVLLCRDMVRHYGGPAAFERDFVTIQNRVRSEGFSFLTKVLPTLAKALDNALVVGAFTIPYGLKKLKGTEYPVFLGTLFKRVLRSDGSVKIDPCISAVKDLRQILYLVYKYEEDFDEVVIHQNIRSFKACDESLGWSFKMEDQQKELAAIMTCSRTLLRDVFGHNIDDFKDIIPRHGPGAVATGEKNWEKMGFKRKYLRLHQSFPYYKFFISHAMDLKGRVDWYKNLEQHPSGCARVVFVPKDSRGPRLISMEPLEFQWIQQGLARAVVDRIERSPTTRGHVNFSDQEINRALALEGSLSSDIVTLDMKEASDRISLWLVQELFKDLPLLELLEATRTEATELPTGEIHLLRKFAPMGSALCFPIESIVHWALAVSTLHVCNSITFKRAMEAVYVYGDDIVIKGQNHEPLMTIFPKLGLQFNEGKCCTTGIFRESCGMDAILGECVTPLKVKKRLPSSPYDATGYVSYIAYVNTLIENMYHESANYIADHLTDVFGKIPYVEVDSDCPGYIVSRFHMSNANLFPKKWNKDLHKHVYKVRKLRAKKLSRPLDRSEYQRKLVITSNEFVAGIYSVPRRVKLQLGWSSDLIKARGGESRVNRTT